MLDTKTETGQGMEVVAPVTGAGMETVGLPVVTRTTAAPDPTATVMGTAMETTAMRRVRTVVGRTTMGVAVAVMGMGTEAIAPVR
jgi:hypothetical protein